MSAPAAERLLAAGAQASAPGGGWCWRAPGNFAKRSTRWRWRSSRDASRRPAVLATIGDCLAGGLCQRPARAARRRAAMGGRAPKTISIASLWEIGRAAGRLVRVAPARPRPRLRGGGLRLVVRRRHQEPLPPLVRHEDLREPRKDTGASVSKQFQVNAFHARTLSVTLCWTALAALALTRPLKHSAAFLVRLDTTKGPIVIECVRAWAPLGADRFYELVTTGYYDDAAIFRIRPKTWAQFGIAGDPKVAQAWRPRTIPDDPFKPSPTCAARSPSRGPCRTAGRRRCSSTCATTARRTTRSRSCRLAAWSKAWRSPTRSSTNTAKRPAAASAPASRTLCSRAATISAEEFPEARLHQDGSGHRRLGRPCKIGICIVSE